MANSLTPPGWSREANDTAARRSDTLREMNSYLLSAVCHLTALVLLGLLSAAVNSDSSGIQLQLQVGDGDDVFAGDEGALPGDEGLDESASDALAALEQQRVFDFQAVATTSFEAVDVPLESLEQVDSPLNDKDVAKQVDRSLERLAGLGGSGLGEAGEGADAWSGRGSINGSEQGFFGIGDSGKSFVYVVDCSDSMNEHNKFRRAKYELMHSLEQLSNGQQYFVIFYSESAYPMDADEPVAATELEVARTSEWIGGVVAGGGTNPLPALLYAVAMQPDAIYFLTDGQFEPQVVLELRGRNRDHRRLKQRQIPIHTIAFGDRRAEGLLKAISRHSGGKYRFVK